MHKHRPLVIPFIVTSSDGYIIDILGPFDANISDAKIMNSISENNNRRSSFFKPGDVFLVDRGFRDSVKTLEKLGLDVHMQEFIEKGNEQLSCEQAK